MRSLKKEGRKKENQGKREKWGRRKRKGSGGDAHMAKAEGRRGKKENKRDWGLF